MEESRVAGFDMRQFGHQEKGPMRMITNSMQIAKKNEQEMPEPKTTSVSENQHRKRRSRQVDKRNA